MGLSVSLDHILDWVHPEVGPEREFEGHLEGEGKWRNYWWGLGRWNRKGKVADEMWAISQLPPWATEPQPSWRKPWEPVQLNSDTAALKHPRNEGNCVFRQSYHQLIVKGCLWGQNSLCLLYRRAKWLWHQWIEKHKHWQLEFGCVGTEMIREKGKIWRGHHRVCYNHWYPLLHCLAKYATRNLRSFWFDRSFLNIVL